MQMLFFIALTWKMAIMRLCLHWKLEQILFDFKFGLKLNKPQWFISEQCVQSTLAKCGKLYLGNSLNASVPDHESYCCSIDGRNYTHWLTKIRVMHKRRLYNDKDSALNVKLILDYLAALADKPCWQCNMHGLHTMTNYEASMLA